MKKIFTALTASAMALGGSTGAFAAETAMQEALRINACSGSPTVSARYLETGRLEVTCSAGALSNTGLNSTTALAVGAGLLILWVILDESTSTTTTPSI